MVATVGVVSLAVGFGITRRAAVEPIVPMQAELLTATGAPGPRAVVGTTWVVTVDVRRTLRVWRNQTTRVLECADAPASGCEVRDGSRVARVPLSAPGEYRAIALTPGAAPLNSPASFDDDVRLARRNGAAYEVVEPIVVY